MGGLVHLAATTDGRAIADALEAVAAQLRAGEIVADRGVLVLGNSATMRFPQRLGLASSTSEVMGMLAFASSHVFQAEAGE